MKKWSVGFIFPILAIGILLTFSGCGFFQHSEDSPDVGGFQLDNNSARVLPGTSSGRLESAGEGLSFQQVRDASASARIVSAFSDSYSVVARIRAPSSQVGNSVLGANHVYVSAEFRKAYVSYNLPGSKRYGAIDIIDIADPANPSLVQSVLFADTDINATFVYKYGTGGFLYIAGSMAESRLAELSTSQTADWYLSRNATLERFTVMGDGTIDFGRINSKLTNLPGYQTTSVYQTSSPADRYVFATSGDDPSAGTFAFSYGSFPNMIDKDLYDNAKYLDIELDASLTGRYPKHVTLEGGRGSSGTLHIYTVGRYDASAHVKIDIGEVDTSETRNTVDLYKNVAYAALGSVGMKAWDVSRPSEQPLYVMEKTDPGAEIVCNSVASDAQNVFFAMGAGGFWVAPLSQAGSDGSLAPFQSMNFGASANFVTYDPSSGLIFVASGLEGLQIIKKE